MAIGNVPSVFVSSTCYDLRQVRTDIRSFIETLGFKPLLSNYNSFPTDPDITAVENCLRVVGEQADIFVLIVGGRYGTLYDSDKSVTNLEYLQAKAKGIPVYAFVEKSILAILPVWKDNPDGDFKNVVDSPKLFEFVTSLRGSSGVWVFEFETAQEITDTLRMQLAYLFMDALQLRTRVRSNGLPESLSNLQGEALRLVIEQPKAWETRLFSAALAHELSKHRQLKQDLIYGVSLGKGEYLSYEDYIFWSQRKLAFILRLARVTSDALNVALEDAMRPPGVPADPEGIIYAAKKLAEGYRSAIEWSLEFQHIEVDDELQNLVRITAGLTSNMIREIEDYSAMLQREIKLALASLPPTGQTRTMDFTLTLTMPDIGEFEQEMERLSRLYGYA